MKLFRQQALEHQHRLHGEVFLVSPLPWRAILALLGALLLVAASALMFGTSARSLSVSGLLQGEADGRWHAELFVPASAAMQVRVGQPVQITLIADAAPDADALWGTVQRIGTLADEQIAVAVTLDPLTLAQRARGIALRPDRPLAARILLNRETLWQMLTRSHATERR